MTPLKQAAALGQSIWIDYLSRDLLQSGRLMRLVSEGVVGVTSNPTIFEQAISAGKGYDEQLRDVRARTSDPKEMFLELAVRDVTEACDQLREVYDAGIAAMRDAARPRHVDGLVSIEVDPSFAYDTEATTAEAKRLHALIDRPNLLVKIPATKPGLPAIEDMIAAGHSINVTLIFSLQRYAEVAEAYIRGIERLVAAGGDPSRVVSVASFFVSRVDTETDRRLDELGAPPELKGKLAIANAKLAYRHYKQAFSSERWEYLASKGAMTQRCLWASTSTKNPAYSDVLYVEELIGPETVNTLPEKTILAFQDHGRASATLERGIDEAEALLERLSDVGIDYDDVTETLERQGVQAFADSFEKLLNGIRTRALAA
ncbi:MAG: transaldolase [Gammaproteobacteria bacterium]|nr:transaldolase [Gammaproteobacteria bacterium]